jgi:hypothetical protein
MAALEILLIIFAVILGIICAKIPYKHNISNSERINFMALPP